MNDTVAVAKEQWTWVRRALLGGVEPRGRAVLDLGCGRGEFLTAARADGWRVAGLELDPACLEACALAGLPVQAGSLFETGVPAGPWDVITFWDVLDHLEDPALALRLAARELSPGGVVVVRGRNARIHGPMKRVYARLRPAAERLSLPDLSVVHRWGLSAAGYARMLRAAGLADVRLYAGIPTPGDRYGVLGPPALAAALKGLLRLGATCLFRAGRGSLYLFPSVLAVGRRSSPPARAEHD